MPTPYGFTKKAKLEGFIARNPGRYTTGELASRFDYSPASVGAAMAEFAANNPTRIVKVARGEWWVKYPKGQKAP